MLTFPVGLISNKGEKILITMQPTALFTAGITLVFAIGSLKINWKDGSPPEDFISGAELTHEYVDAGTYIAEITGDFVNITQFDCNNSRVTFIENLTTGMLTLFRFYQNLYSGVLDLSKAPVSGLIEGFTNSGLSDIIFATSGNGTVTKLNLQITGVINLDLTNVIMSGELLTDVSGNLVSITHAPVGNGAMSNYSVSRCDLPNQDFSVFPTSDNINIKIWNNSLTATEHDNQLINLDNTGWINGILNIIAGNTARTAASDTAFNNLISNGWSII